MKLLAVCLRTLGFQLSTEVAALRILLRRVAALGFIAGSAGVAIGYGILTRARGVTQEDELPTGPA
jgi:hypothetical protein